MSLLSIDPPTLHVTNERVRYTVHGSSLAFAGAHASMDDLEVPPTSCSTGLQEWCALGRQRPGGNTEADVELGSHDQS